MEADAQSQTNTPLCIYIYMYTFINTCTYMFVYSSKCLHIYMYTCIYTHMFTCSFIYYTVYKFPLLFAALPPLIRNQQLCRGAYAAAYAAGAQITTPRTSNGRYSKDRKLHGQYPPPSEPGSNMDESSCLHCPTVEYLGHFRTTFE